MLHRRNLLRHGAGLAAGLAFARPALAWPGPVTLRLHHFLPAVSNIHRNVLVPWSRQIEQASGGNLRIRIFPSMQLGGAPQQLYDQARDGVADIVWTLPGYTAGRFPRIEVMELPFIANKGGVENASACHDFAASSLGDEFSEVQPLVFWAHDGGLIHTRKPVSNLEDLRGLKLRFPTRQSGEALRALGAAPIGMPLPQVPEALSQGVLDGAVVPWEVVPTVKLHELLHSHTAVPGRPTLYTSTNILAMNKNRYSQLPAELRQVLDTHSGTPLAEKIGMSLDDQATQNAELVRRRGNTVSEISADEAARWRQATAPVAEAWLSRMKHDGGEALLAAARASFARHAA
ncbi:TRAP transporter substrate-binding protein [Pseudoroseomonas globiformis]|uniref:TRAP transporter substrate-binding protein n=1 Tax=Teichococcus globiformis TaxID=2307229 RepID=A0ABV7FZC0_9PROT